MSTAEVPRSFYTRLSTTHIAVVDLSDHSDDMMIITRINVPMSYRNRGHARELMRKVLFATDRAGVTLALFIMPSGSMSSEQLAKWYERLGFRDNGYGMMIRKPGRTHLEG